VTAGSFLNRIGVEYGGHMVAALALMESPAIIIGLVLVRVFASRSTSAGSKLAVDEEESFAWGEVLRESFLNGSVYLLIGSLLVGLITSKEGWEQVEPFTGDMFYGVLTFFLLDMGLVAARRLQDLRKGGSFLIGFSILMPVFNALIGIAISALLHMTPGNALLFAVLCASASYIAVPAAMRMTVPEANPSLYISMALALTFPFNIIIGIPVYYQLIQRLWGVA
jgi:uncharacterized protein